MSANVLTPAAVLVLWSLAMLFWMAGARLPQAKKMGVDISKAVGGRGSDLDPAMPPPVAWKSHNYAHLMEQPTIFYATIAILAIAGAGTDGINVALAWGYALIRIVHSIWQATVNKVQTRFLLFLASTLCLIVLAVRALLATL
ncbi:MAPEG family protein [Blastomonas sp.]|uniref:MAPEG family protein n=1 Tax=Blastomonas sp. TaxID=1909299 RepID=UPI00262021C7|nr:MAPEG family protein [Blastomonas sp.]MDM7956292.1 MAPEG family protein [Blastomonas sp.]